MVVTPPILTLLGLLIAAVSALIAGGVAWGRFAAALDQLRQDHRDLAARVERAIADGAEIGVLRQSLADLRAEVSALRDHRHRVSTDLARIGGLLERRGGNREPAE